MLVVEEGIVFSTINLHFGPWREKTFAQCSQNWFLAVFFFFEKIHPGTLDPFQALLCRAPGIVIEIFQITGPVLNIGQVQTAGVIVRVGLNEKEGNVFYI